MAGNETETTGNETAIEEGAVASNETSTEGESAAPEEGETSEE